MTSGTRPLSSWTSYRPQRRPITNPTIPNARSSAAVAKAAIAMLCAPSTITLLKVVFRNAVK